MTAFLIAAIQGDYELQEVGYENKQALHSARTGSFQDFPQREYDYEKLEQQLVMNRIQQTDEAVEEGDIQKMLKDIRK